MAEQNNNIAISFDGLEIQPQGQVDVSIGGIGRIGGANRRHQFDPADIADATMVFLRDEAEFEKRRSAWRRDPMSKHHYACFRLTRLKSMNLSDAVIHTDVIEAEIKAKFVEQEKERHAFRVAEANFFDRHPLNRDVAFIDAKINAEWAAMTDDRKTKFMD